MEILNLGRKVVAERLRREGTIVKDGKGGLSVGGVHLEAHEVGKVLAMAAEGFDRVLEGDIKEAVQDVITPTREKASCGGQDPSMFQLFRDFNRGTLQQE